MERNASGGQNTVSGIYSMNTGRASYRKLENKIELKIIINIFLI